MNKPYIDTKNLHPLFQAGTMMYCSKITQLPCLYINSWEGDNDIFSEFPETVYLNNPDTWLKIREKVDMATQLGVSYYGDILNDITRLLNDILILSLAEKRTYWEQYNNFNGDPCWRATFESIITYKENRDE